MIKKSLLFFAYLGAYLFIFIKPVNTYAQLEVNLLTDCTTGDLGIPVEIKNFDNVSSLELILDYNPSVLSFDKSTIHNPNFTLNNDSRYAIEVSDNPGRIRIIWSAYYGVSIMDKPLLFLNFKQVGEGSSNFSWAVSESHIYQIGNVEQNVTYHVQSNLSLPVVSPYTIQVNQLTKGCRDDSENGCKAQAEVVLSGGKAPFQYQWNDKFNQKTKIALGLCQEAVSVIVTDADACIFGAIFQAKIHPANVMEITADPEKAYITRPNVNFESNYLDFEPEAYRWDFGDEATATSASANHSYEQIGNYQVSLWTRSKDGCDTTVYINNYEVQELDFCIPNVFTPNGDNVNDRWVFKIGSPPAADNGSGLKTGYYKTNNCSGDDLIMNEYFKHTHLVVVNRNGNKVYECSDCSESWDGGNLPDGVYFYVFKWEGEYSNGREQGDVTILRGK
jgi:PKD repeat protein